MKTAVAITKCRSYSQGELDKAVERTLELLGGIEKFIKPNEKVLIKPNLLSTRTPEEAVNTHPELIRAVIKKVRPISGNIKIGDSAAGFGDNMDEIHRTSGVKEIAEEEAVELIKFDSSKRIGRYPIASDALEADKVISLPKFKTHGLTLITAAVKNMYGIVPGISKAEQHSLAPRADDFASVILDVFCSRKPELTIVDAVESMEGEGPAGGNVRKTDFIAASADAVALDSALMKIIGMEPLDLVTNKEARKRGIGATDLKDIDVLGEGLDAVKVEDFKLPGTGLANRIPKSLSWLIRLVIRFRVEIDGTKCRRCDLCRESCPVNAITIGKKTCSVDYSKCLLCLCCQEICPHGAVRLRKSWFARMMWG